MRYRVYIAYPNDRLVCGVVMYRDGNSFKRSEYRDFFIGSNWSECEDGVWKDADILNNRFAIPENNKFFNIGVLLDGLAVIKFSSGYHKAQVLAIKYLSSLKS